MYLLKLNQVILEQNMVLRLFIIFLSSGEISRSISEMNDQWTEELLAVEGLGIIGNICGNKLRLRRIDFSPFLNIKDTLID